MNGSRRFYPVVHTVAIFALALPWAVSASAEEPTPADSGLQREYARLAQQLASGNHFEQQEAAKALLKVRPSDVANPDTRKLIARGYLAMVKESRGLISEEAVEGLVHWGGKHSVPILIDMLDGKGMRVPKKAFDALGELKDPRAAEPIARHLGDFFTHDAAARALRKMGPAAEDALIDVAPSSDPDISLAAIQLLGEVGTEKSLKVLQRASAARNYAIKQAAREALKRVRNRQRSGDEPEEPTIDPDSPFAEGSGPPIDIRASSRNRVPKFPSGARDDFFGDPGDEELESLEEGDWALVNVILPGDPAAEGVAPDTAAEEPPSAWKPQPIGLGRTQSRSERPVALAVAGGKTPTAVVVHQDPFNDSFARMELVNLLRRRSEGSTTVPGGVKLCCLSPSGARVLLASEEDLHDPKLRLDVWSLADGKPAELATWWPFATSDDFRDNQIIWAAWVDEDQLLAANGMGTLVLWRLDGKSPRAIYQIEATGRSMPALSPGRAHLAMATPRGVEIFRAADGELLARMGGIRPGAGAVAFNADGSHLACVSGSNVCVWDAETGKLLRDFDCSELRGGSLQWVDKRHLLVGGTDIVDAGRRILLWRYEGMNVPTATLGDRQWLAMQHQNVSGLMPVELLQEEVLAAAEALDPDELLAVKPGVKIALDVQLSGDDQQKAETALRAALEQNEIEVADDSPIKLSARIVHGETKTAEYGTGFFFRENREQVSVTEKRYEVELTVDGQSAWKQASMLQSGWTPMVVTMRDGESAQQAIDRQNALRSANFSFSAAIPRYVVHPKYRGPLGTSNLSLAGAR